MTSNLPSIFILCGRVQLMIHFVVNTSLLNFAPSRLFAEIFRVRLLRCGNATPDLLVAPSIRLTVCAFSLYLAASTKKHFLDSV